VQERLLMNPFLKAGESAVGNVVMFAVEMDYDLTSGKSQEWQRLKIANME